jgi:glycosyltransferase involved in cell wall biosynthesis
LNQKKPTLLVIANTNIGTSLSGGDQIFLNIVKYWQPYFDVTVLGSSESHRLLAQKHLHQINFIMTDSASPYSTTNLWQLFRHYLRRLSKGLIAIIRHSELRHFDYVYTASDFWPDFGLGYLLKLLRPQICWLAGYYLFAPWPLDPQSPYFKNHQILKGLVYYLCQIPSHFIASYFTDYIFVTSEPDVDKFRKHQQNKHISVIRGGVYVPNFSTYRQSLDFIPISKRPYAACFLGRLHPQKGVLELIDIWAIVRHRLPSAKLIIVGDGELLPSIKAKIGALGLDQHIFLAGFQTGIPKYRIFRQSKIVVHPSVFDSGGMAAAEAMAWGLPGVSFDLPALTSYYPQGMLKTPLGDFKQFAANIVSLLTNPRLYRRTSHNALDLIKKHWRWQPRLVRLSRQIRYRLPIT